MTRVSADEINHDRRQYIYIHDMSRSDYRQLCIDHSIEEETSVYEVMQTIYLSLLVRVPSP
jgi:hypothetical protein